MADTDRAADDPRGAYETPVWDGLVAQRPSFYEGLDLFHWLMHVDSWSHRRVEQVDLLDDRSVRRRISVDFELPSNEPEREIDDEPVDLVPLALLTKEPLIGFDLRDEGGNVVPLLTREQNAFFSWSLLAAVGEAAARDAGFTLPLPLDVLSDLRLLTSERSEKAREVLKTFQKPRKRESRFLRRALMRDEVFASLAEALTNNFLLLVVVGHRTSTRRVLKFSYVEPLPWPSFRMIVSRNWRSLVWIVRMQLGLEPIPLAFDVPAFNETASYHFELEVPRGLIVESAELVDDDSNTVLVEIVHPRSSRVHLYASPDIDSEGVTSWVWVQPALGGLVRTASFFAVAVASLLVVLAIQHDVIRLSAAMTLLLTIPALLGAFIVRPGEHLLASRLLFGFRFIAGILGLLPFLNALTLVVGIPEHAREVAWWVVAIVGVILAWIASQTYASAKAVAFPKK